MSYLQNLKTLRDKMLEFTTGQVPKETSTSLIPTRQEQLPQETSETLIDRSARWLSQIRGTANEVKQQAKPKSSGGFAKGFQASVKTASEENVLSAKEAFIAKRGEERLPTHASDKGKTTAVPVDAEVKTVLDAIASVESKGSGDYKAMGPVVKKGQYTGQRAYGRYQVMEGNISSWTKEALGRSLTPVEFLNDEGAQDAVAAHQLTKSRSKYGTWEDAASVWFSGRPMAAAGNASDGYTTVPEYIAKFRRSFSS